jgi:hypothetical protein
VLEASPDRAGDAYSHRPGTACGSHRPDRQARPSSHDRCAATQLANLKRVLSVMLVYASASPPMHAPPSER